MAETAVFDAIEGLYQALAGSAALSAMQPAPCRVDNGFPDGGPQAPHHVWIPAEIDDWERDYQVSGLSALEETFRLRVYAMAFVRPTATWRDHRDPIVTLVDAIAKAVHDDPTLDGAVRLAVPGRASMGESFTEKFRTLDAVLWIDCEATVCP